MEVIKKQIVIKKVKIEGVFFIRSFRPDGVKVVKKILNSALECKVNGSVKIRIYTLGAPRYKIEVEANDYKTAEKVLAAAVRKAEEVAKKEKAIFQFKRE